MPDCRNQLIAAGAAAVPRSCPTCGLAGRCERDVTPPLPAALTPLQVRDRVVAVDVPAFARAVDVVNSCLTDALDLAAGVWIDADRLGPNIRVRDRVLAHFQAAGWAVERKSSPSDGVSYVFKG